MLARLRRLSRRWHGAQGALLVVAISGVLFATGCGGDESEAARGGGEEEPRGVSLSKPEFLVEAAKACKEASRGLDQEASLFLANQKPSKPRVAKYEDLSHLVLLPAIERELESIRLLGVPPSEVKRIDEILNEGEDVIDKVVFETHITSAGAVYRQFAGVHRMFRAYGLPACVRRAPG
jgi:hypothetical protein